MSRYRLVVSYDGTNYAGWQVQKTGLSVQSLIQKFLHIVLRHPLDLTGSGRTDAGVHALGQTAHFDTPVFFKPTRLRTSLNALLPNDIRILEIQPVPDDFHARYSALSKIYHYHLQLDGVANPFARLYRYHVPAPCDLTLFKQAIPHFLGTHDFTSFANQADRGSASRDPIRTLMRLDLVSQPGGVRLEFEANGFLYKMVRNIVGTLLDVAASRIDPAAIPSILKAADRRRAGAAAPPHGLFLMHVNYDSLSEGISSKDSKCNTFPSTAIPKRGCREEQINTGSAGV
jgi:tRNA pseudouridine38-40 synthase